MFGLHEGMDKTAKINHFPKYLVMCKFNIIENAQEFSAILLPVHGDEAVKHKISNCIN
jgi:hypothetical protein